MKANLAYQALKISEKERNNQLPASRISAVNLLSKSVYMPCLGCGIVSRDMLHMSKLEHRDGVTEGSWSVQDTGPLWQLWAAHEKQVTIESEGIQYSFRERLGVLGVTAHFLG